MLTLLVPLVVLQAPVEPPGTKPQDRRYGWGRSNRASVTVNGKAIAGRAIIRDNRIQVPMRPIFEALGANVTWYPENRKVVALRGRKTISLILGQNFAYDPRPVMLDYPPRMVRNTVYVPLRFVAQSLGAKVGFDRRTKVAHVELSVREARTP